MAPVDLAEISFFELDRLFTESARALERKIRRRRRKNKLNPEKNAEAKDDDAQVISPSRSRTPPRRSRLSSKMAPFGGWTGCMGKIEKCVIVSGVPPTAQLQGLHSLFSKCGSVQDLQVLENRQDQRTGICVVEFQDDESVARACMLAPAIGQMNGADLQVKRADQQIQKGTPAPKKMMTRSEFTQQVLSGLKTGFQNEPKDGPNMRKLWIKNLRPVVTEEDMQGIFKPFGDFENFTMGSQECWITFNTHSDAQDALTSMQGFQLVGQELQIAMQSVDVMAPVVPPPPAMPPPPPKTLEQQMATDSDFGATGSAGGAGRIELMKKLLSSQEQKGIPGVVGSAMPPPPPGVGGGVPPPPPAAGGAAGMPPTPKPGGPAARTLLLQNMFSPEGVNLQKDPRFYEEIREDTHEECAKFGKVLHVTVDPRGANGVIYVLYESPAQRNAAEMALNGRWFEGKKIMAAGIDDSIWQALAAQAK